MTAREILTALAAPFDPDSISWRVGSTTQDKSKGMALAYIDARDVQARLDAVMGADWQCEYVPMPNGTCCCRIGLKIDGEWRWRSNGAGATDVEGEKGQYSDAFKRAAVMWNVGAYLYALDSPWVRLEQKGRTHVIAADQHAVLRRALTAGRGKPAQQPAPPPAEPELPAVRQYDASTARLPNGALVNPAPPPPQPRPNSTSQRAAAAAAASPARGRGQPADTRVSGVSGRIRGEMLHTLAQCATASDLAEWEQSNSRDSGKWQRMTIKTDFESVKQAHALKRKLLINGADTQAPLN